MTLLCHQERAFVSGGICKALQAIPLGQTICAKDWPRIPDAVVNFRNEQGQLACWLKQLHARVWFHQPGRKRGNADAISRMLSNQCGRESNDDQVSVITVSTLNLLASREQRAPQLGNAAVWFVLQVKEDEHKPTADQVKASPVNSLCSCGNGWRRSRGFYGSTMLMLMERPSGSN